MLQARDQALATRRIRACIWYVAGYLILSGLALLLAPHGALAAMLEHGLRRYHSSLVGMLSVAMERSCQIVRLRIAASSAEFLHARHDAGRLGRIFSRQTHCFS
jgi:hypothetical protein